MADACRVSTPAQERWVFLPKTPSRPEPVARFYSPSQQTVDGADAVLQTLELPGPCHFPSGAREEQYAAIGDAVHAYMASLPSTRSLSDKERECIAERCLVAFSVTGLLSPTVLVSAGERFCAWVEKTFPGAQWHTEVGLTAPRAAGGQWFGSGDVLLDLPDGACVIVDHKDAPIRREHCAAKAATFAGQITAALRPSRPRAGKSVRPSFIFPWRVLSQR